MFKIGHVKLDYCLYTARQSKEAIYVCDKICKIKSVLFAKSKYVLELVNIKREKAIPFLVEVGFMFTRKNMRLNSIRTQMYRQDSYTSKIMHWLYMYI